MLESDHQSMGVTNPMDRHLVSLAAPRCPGCKIVHSCHQSMGVVSPVDRHLESLKASRCPIVVVALLDLQPPGVGGDPKGRHLKCLSANRCPSS